MYRLFTIKRIIEDIFIFPFVILGRAISYIRPLEKEYKIFFFFPFYHIGGAEKVHAQVAQVVGNDQAIIFFTKRSHNDLFLEAFQDSGCIIRDISPWTGNKWLYFMNIIYRGIITGYINRQKEKPIVFNGQCNFAYKISPWINKTIPQIELIHSLNSFSYIRIPFLPFIKKTVMISKKRIEDHEILYRKYKIPAHYINRILYIPNAIPLPANNNVIKNNEFFKVLYVGRGTPEKRVHLIVQMAEILKSTLASVQFEMLGDVSEAVDPNKYEYIKFWNNQSDEKVIGSIYTEAHLLLLTSDTEGFPMVIIEAMAHGCAILSTAVGDIPLHITNEVNGYLFNSITDEARIVEEGIQKIRHLKSHPELFNTISKNNISYAKHNFDIAAFNETYHQLFASLKPGI